jgi:hypothetical protein
MLGQFQLIPPEVIQRISYVVLFLLVAPLFPFIYVVLRWRTEGAQEPGVGTYGGLLYFRTAALLLVIAGAANLTYGYLSTTPVDDELTRMSWGLFIGSVLFMGLNTWLGRFVDVPKPQHARRVFGGFLMIMAGLVALFVLILFFITVFTKVPEDNAKAVDLHADDLKLYGSWAAYYLATYLTATVLLARGAKAD